MSMILKSKELGNGMSAQAGYRNGELMVWLIVPSFTSRSVSVLYWYPDSESKALKILKSFKRISERNYKQEFEKYLISSEDVCHTELVPTTKTIKKDGKFIRKEER